MILFDAALGYLAIGFVIWLVMDGLGIIADTVAARSAHGRPVRAPALTIATVWLIVMWPMVVWAVVRGWWGDEETSDA